MLKQRIMAQQVLQAQQAQAQQQHIEYINPNTLEFENENDQIQNDDYDIY